MKFTIPPLSSYLKDIADNLSDHNKTPPELMYLINDMDDFFRNEVFIDSLDINPISALLCMNGFMQLNASVCQALTGHVVTVFPLVRAALEAACYGFIISKDDAHSVTWHQRHSSNDDLKKCRKLFTVANTVKYLNQISEEMAQYVAEVYAAAIDFGAHPNTKSIMNHLDHHPQLENDHTYVRMTGIYGINSWEVNHALLACVETGHAIIFLTAATYIDHPLLGKRVSKFNDLVNAKIEMIYKYTGSAVDNIKPVFASATKS